MDIKDIKPLIDKYMDGLTSGDEEAKLREFFTSPGSVIPDEWRVYKALFAYEAEEREALGSSAATPSPQLQEPATDPTPQPAAPAPRRRPAALRRWMWAASAAASVAIVIGLTVGRTGHPRDYAVIDGRVVTDRSVVTDEAEDALDIVSSSGQDDFSALQLMQ